MIRRAAIAIAGLCLLCGCSAREGPARLHVESRFSQIEPGFATNTGEISTYVTVFPEFDACASMTDVRRALDDISRAIPAAQLDAAGKRFLIDEYRRALRDGQDDCDGKRLVLPIP